MDTRDPFGGDAVSKRWWDQESDTTSSQTTSSQAATAHPPVSTAVQRWRGNDPFMRAVSRSNAETTALASQRLQAVLGVSSRFAACRTPFDVMQEQIRFLQTATDQYSAAMRNIQAAWTPVMPAFGLWQVSAPASAIVLPHTIARTVTAPKQPMAPERDMITFREPAETAVPPKRRAA